MEKVIYAFESIISKQTLSDYEKFIYLKGQLQGGPLALVNSLSATEQSYGCAKQLLEQAFASPLTQKYEAIKRLTELKLMQSDDVYVFIREMRNISSIGSLKMDVNTILQYFIWPSLNERFQTQLINITNNSKPSLDEINSNIFAATERYLKMNKQHNEKRGYSNNERDHNAHVKTNNLAIKVSTKQQRPCSLCIADKKI